MVVKQANITSYKVSDPSDILDRRPVYLILIIKKFQFIFLGVKKYFDEFDKFASYSQKLNWFAILVYVNKNFLV